MEHRVLGEMESPEHEEDPLNDIFTEKRGENFDLLENYVGIDDEVDMPQTGGRDLHLCCCRIYPLQSD